MKALVIWPGLTGYMSDGWRALARRVELKVLLDGVGLGKGFSDEVMTGLDWDRVTASDAVEKVRAFAPDVVVLVGWRRRVPRKIAQAKELADIPKLMVMDMPYRASLKCLLAPLVLRRYLRRFRGVLVPGEASARYARHLGFAEQWIFRHTVFVIDVKRFAAAAAGKTARTGFLFVGRKVRAKGLGTLEKAYRRYRTRGGTWPLSVPAWINPRDVPAAMAQSACLVLPSRWEPWGVVVAEAKAAGMRVIVSDRVNARFDIPCDGVFPAGDAEALAREMLAAEKAGAPERTDMSHWDSSAWVERLVKVFEEVTNG